MPIARLMCEQRLLREEDAELLAQLEAARTPGPAAAEGDRLEARLPAGPGGRHEELQRTPGSWRIGA